MAKRVVFSLLKWIVLLAIIVWVGERIQVRDLAWPVETSRDSAASGRLQKSGPSEAEFIRGDGTRLLLTARIDEGPGGGLSWIDRETGRAWNVQMGYLYRFGNISWPDLFLAAAGIFLCLSFPGIRWHWLLKAAGLGFSLGEACRLNWIGIFFSTAMPGTTGGDVVKTYYAMKRTESKSLPVLTIVMDRVLGCIALVLLALCALLVNAETHRILNWKVLAAVPVLLLAAAFLFSVSWKYARRLPVLQRPSISGHLDQVEHAIGLYRTQKAMLLFWVGMSFANHVFFALSVGVLGRAMGFDASFGNYLTIVPVVNLGSAFSITPAGWGVGEALFDLLFVKFAGQAPGSGAGVAVMVRAMALLPFFVGGFLYMCARREYGRRAAVETSC